MQEKGELHTELLLLKRPAVFERIIAGGPGAELELAKLEWRTSEEHSDLAKDLADGTERPSVESESYEVNLRRLVQFIDELDAVPRCEVYQLPLPLSCGWPIHSRMTPSEANALLTQPGTRWFLSQATGLLEERVERLCRLGMPWPICRPAGLSTESSNIRPERLTHLDRLFQKPQVSRDRLLWMLGYGHTVVSDPEANALSSRLRLANHLGIDLQNLEAIIGPTEVPVPLPAGRPARDWRDIYAEGRATPHCEMLANAYNEDMAELQMTADALVAYSSCLTCYGYQCMVNRAES